MRLIDADEHECWACAHHATGKCDTWCEHGESFELRKDVAEAKTVDAVPVVRGEWIPFKLREADEEETEAYGLAEMLCGELPEDGEEILVTYDNGYVGIDTFIWDGCECYLNSNREFCTEAIAWQRKPAPYVMRKKVEE